MNGIDARIRAWLTWALPFVVIALLVGWETDWGHALKRVPAVDGKVAAQPVPVALLPEYRIEVASTVDAKRSSETLFNPTRRPAPPQASSAAKSAVQTGQFVLTGTTVVDKKATAFFARGERRALASRSAGRDDQRFARRRSARRPRPTDRR
jgi:hypothetical protein